ncbi:MAG: hypothetical protein EOO31_08910 [Comamonadaceae bacterium]|nr:MAG: hypothetical protein EOO31_08910 [Comamonadaceae bacterium]
MEQQHMALTFADIEKAIETLTTPTQVWAPVEEVLSKLPIGTTSNAKSVIEKYIQLNVLSFKEDEIAGES